MRSFIFSQQALRTLGVVSRTTYGEHRHQTMAKVVVYRWIKTTEYFYGVIQKGWSDRLQESCNCSDFTGKS